jgi:RNA polymerase sigma-70 factor, ECF subfamily
VQAIATHLRSIPDPQEGLESLFREHHNQIYRTAYRITGSTVDAEDVLQTVFLRLVRRKEGCDLSPSPANYLMRATINASLDTVRARKSSRSVQLDNIDSELLASPGLNPEDQQVSREMRRLVREAVAQLGPKAAEILVLRYFEGYGNQEIAQILGMSQLVVAVMLHRARTRLRKDIGKFLEGHHEAN